MTFETMEIPACGRGTLSSFLTLLGRGHWTRTGPTGGVVLLARGVPTDFARSKVPRPRGTVHPARKCGFQGSQTMRLYPASGGHWHQTTGLRVHASPAHAASLLCALGAPPALFTIARDHTVPCVLSYIVLVRLTGSWGRMIGTLGRYGSTDTRSTCGCEPSAPKRDVVDFPLESGDEGIFTHYCRGTGTKHPVRVPAMSWLAPGWPIPPRAPGAREEQVGARAQSGGTARPARVLRQQRVRDGHRGVSVLFPSWACRCGLADRGASRHPRARAHTHIHTYIHT